MGSPGRFALATAILGVFGAISACSSTPAHPPELGNCAGDDAGTKCVTAGASASGGGGSGTGGSAGASDDGAIGTTCGLGSDDPTCEACLEQNCCSLANACSNVSDCDALTSCLNLCLPTNQPCITGCQSKYPGGTAAYNNFSQCMASTCASECQNGTGSTTSTDCGQLAFQSPTCNTCVTASCCTQSAACTNNQDCRVLDLCLVTCQPTDTTCVTSCQNENQSGVAIYNGLSQCLQTSCAGSCP